jgi:ribosomal protein S6
MNSMAISLGGLRASMAQFQASASNIVQARIQNNQATTLKAQATGQRDFAHSIVQQRIAVSNFRANIAAINAQDKMTKATLDLIC